MEAESRTKTILMTLGLAAFVSVGAACFGLLRTDPPPADPASVEVSCEKPNGEIDPDCDSDVR